MIRLQGDINEDLNSAESRGNSADINVDSANYEAESRGDSADSAPDSADSAPDSANITDFATQVFKSLLSKNIPPIPLNYQTYFETLLDSKDIEFQKQIIELMERNAENDERNITFEKSIHAAFANTKDILKCTSSIYKNLVIMNDIEKEWSLDMEGSKSSARYAQETQNIQNEIDGQIVQLKDLYQKCNQILENINTNTMYDSKFDTYNKRYFIYLVQNEQKMIEKFAHSSSIMMMSLPFSVTRYLQNDQPTALIVMKTIAKLLLKTSRRSDIIGYVGNGIFGMMLRHCDLSATKNASERVISLVKNTNVFLDKREVKLDLNIGISLLSAQRGSDESLNMAIGALRNAQREGKPWVVAE